MDFRETGPGAVPLEMLRRYLVATGWHVRSSAQDSAPLDNPAAKALLESRAGGGRNFEVFVSDVSDLTGIELVVPNSIRSSEYSSQVARVIDAISAVEDRAELDVARAIREVAFDVVRSRIPDAMVVDDSIRLEMAQSFVLGIRGVLAAAANTELDPQAYFQTAKTPCQASSPSRRSSGESFSALPAVSGLSLPPLPPTVPIQ
jgi:hypothetical protein